MKFRTFVLATALALPVLGWLGSTPALAQDREAELRRLHHECNEGDRKACVRFGIMLGEERAHHERWRREHPEWFFYEH
jgi:hypothetical protein